MARQLDRLTSRDGRIIDREGRAVVLRGMVTVTADHRGPVELEAGHFDQLAGWGFNVQQVRLEGARLGVLECAPDPAYLDKLERWVDLATERGLYTIFKMTTYDVPSIGGVGGAFNPENWQRWWDRDDWRADRIDAWRPVWERFAGRPEVVGYDVLNEPSIGHDTPDLAARHLFPFYEAVGAALREVDDEALLVVQPPAGTAAGTGSAVGAASHGQLPALADGRAVYAPHFYADLVSELTEAEYESAYRALVAEAAAVGAPLLIGEFGLPNDKLLPRFRVWNRRDEELKGAVFDRFAASAIRPWYVDDGFWAVLGPGFTETERLHALVRPYPQRTPGVPRGWAFEPGEPPRLVVELVTDPHIGAPLVVAAPPRFFPQGVAASVDGDPCDASTAAGIAEVDLSALPAGPHTVTIGWP